MQIVGIGGIGKNLIEEILNKKLSSKVECVIIDKECDFCKKYGIKHFKPDESFILNSDVIIVGGSSETAKNAFKKIVKSNPNKNYKYFVILPFKFEGKKRANNAKEILGFLKDEQVTIYDNQQLIYEVDESVSMGEALDMVKDTFLEFVEHTLNKK